MTRTTTRPDEPLRVALLAGTLAQGGAEKQLLYMARALLAGGVDVRLYSLTAGEFYEPHFIAAGLTPVFVGRFAHPALRLVALRRALAAFRPRIVQSGHFFANLYVALAGRTVGALPIGSIRNDTTYELEANGRWGRWLLHAPPRLIANSHVAKTNAVKLGIAPRRIHVVSNVIDLQQFDGSAAQPPPSSSPEAIVVCRLVEAKRVDRFLRALAATRRAVPGLRGVVVGEGPARPALEAMAATLGLYPDGVQFLGRRDDVPSLLRAAAMLVSTSDHEGFPNVVIEAMAAELPVIATPAGDVGRIVEDGITGCVVPFGDEGALVESMTRLGLSPELRRRMGQAGRRRVEVRYGGESLCAALFESYRDAAATSPRPGASSAEPLPVTSDGPR